MAGSNWESTSPPRCRSAVRNWSPCSSRPARPSRRITLEPVTLEPVTLEPVTLEPVTLEPVTLEPVTLEPVTLELGRRKLREAAPGSICVRGCPLPPDAPVRENRDSLAGALIFWARLAAQPAVSIARHISAGGAV